ncbi:MULTISPECIES: MCE family protein [unclassified Rhodococcus (in: high G+C Gram-positive bacteria)]|uniref:MCE family protein n=1 Tax=Rhodococcus sp. SJ-3 TaxID=3454628 RepID=UPI003F7A86A5
MPVIQEMPGSEQPGTTRPSGRKKIISLVVVALLLIAAPIWYIFGRTDRVTTVHADFEYVNGIYAGSKVAVLGVAVGTVTGIEPQGTSVRVTMTVPEEVTLPADVSAYVMSPAIISERYIELGPAFSDGPELPDGSTIPVERTHSPIDIDGMLGSLSTLVDFMGPDGGDVGSVLASSAETWGGQGEAFNNAIRDLSAATGVIGGTSEGFSVLVDNLSTLIEAMDARQVSLDSMVDDMSALSTVWQDADLDITVPLEQLQTVFAELDSFVIQHQESFGAISTNLEGLGYALTDNKAGLAEFMDLVPLMMQNLENTVGPDGRSRIRLNVSTNLTSFETAGPLCAQHPLPLCTGAGFTNPISFPISASDPLGIVTAITGGNP